MIIEGPFLILSTPYFEDGSVDYDTLVTEAEFADSWGTPGLIWPQSNDSNDLLVFEERIRGMETLCDAWSRKGIKAVLTLGISGDTKEDAIKNAFEAERLIKKYNVENAALCARPPFFGKTDKDVEEYFLALAQVVSHPIIIQTHVNRVCPSPRVEFLLKIAETYPDIYGWLKEESNSLEANNRQRVELASPYIKTVFSAWGGWQWLYQFRRIGTRGLVSERVAYAPIVNYIWERMKNGDDGTLTQAYAMYRLLIDQRNLESDSLRGYSLHYLVRLGVFKNTVSRDYIEKVVTPSGTCPLGDKSVWKLVKYEMSEDDALELDKCYDDMMDFISNHK